MQHARFPNPRCPDRCRSIGVGILCPREATKTETAALPAAGTDRPLIPSGFHPLGVQTRGGSVFAMLSGMCAHYDPQTDPARLKSFFGVSDPPLGLKQSLWPGYFGPFIRKHEFPDVGDEAVPLRELLVGSFGLIPHWAKDATIARNTYNARSETVHEKPSYRDAWRLARHCLIPAEAIYEPDWRSGKAIATRIARADGKPMGIAGLWSSWRNPSGEAIYSYTMLTINADQHPVMRQFHKPDDEKRMVVIVSDANYDAWLAASAADSQAFLTAFQADNLIAEQAQPPRRD